MRRRVLTVKTGRSVHRDTFYESEPVHFPGQVSLETDAFCFRS